MNTKTTNMKKEIIQQLHTIPLPGKKKAQSYSEIGKFVVKNYSDIFPNPTYSRQAIHQIISGYKSPRKSK